MKLGAITLAALTAVSLGAQTTPAIEGSYVLIEEGVLASGAPFASMSKLTIGATGAVTGTQVVQGITYDLQGTYSTDTDGTAALLLTASASNSDGETLIVQQSYKLVRPAAGGAVLVRTNPGIFAAGTLSRSGNTASLGGTYYLGEEPLGRPSARLAVLTFDTSGGVSGYEIVNSMQASGKREIKGSYQANASGFTTLSFAVASIDENGDTVSTAENYMVLATQTELKALRVDSGAARVITLEK